ncbi:right-handed parallel beta-helix repeat-containing protein [Planctomicrobium sp.]|nr:right-handed parallel beta-helix repeat-containing protein [Planctomicrobium sp.]MDB4733716.1 right-handed parallel beta-helix repeat-containing protein [Planctomicrobium sp.]
MNRLQALELTGGSVVIRFGDCENVWLDKCELHHGEHGGITANTHNTSKLYITNNHLHHFESGTGEAMYLGANDSKAIMTGSVIGMNHVHDCAGSQGDGIEIKQGSHHNWIVSNEIHDTKYPCLIAYGTDGNGINLIENNILYRSQNQTLQVQGEAIVRNNLIMAAQGDGFSSTDHQGKTKNLTFVHNTIITSGRGANLSSWGNREGMVFANNAIYSRDNLAVRFPTGCEKVTIAGNVVLGGVQGCSDKSGFTQGNGLSDFQAVNWTASKRNAAPSKLSALKMKADQGFAEMSHLVSPLDVKRKTSGAYE